MEPDLQDVLVAVIAPALFWGAYHLYKDRHQPEPIRNIILSYLLGVGAGYLGLQAYAALEFLGLRFDGYALAETDRLGLLLYAILVIGVVEELVKFIPFSLLLLRLEHFDEPVDGIIYSAFIALGFASYENFHYIQYLQGPEMLSRGIASPLVHIMFASIWGYTCARAKIASRPLLPAAALGLGAASLAHGVYDFVMLGLPAWARPVSAALILAVWIWRMHLIRALHGHAAEP